MSFLKNLGAKPLEQTESHPINQQTKELEATKAYLTAVSKKIKKTVKTTSTLLRGTQDLSRGFEQWSSTIAANDSESHLGACLGTIGNFQTYFVDLLATLGTSIDMKVTEPMVDFTKEEIPTTQSVKKKWDSARKDYDAAINKVTLLQKEKKPNPPKIQQAEQDRERLKAAYLQKGEEAFCSLLDTNEMSEFATLEKMLTYIEAFYQFFRGGYNFLRDVHDNVVISHRQWIAEEKGRYEQRKKKRPAGEWVPDSISGGSTAKTRMFGLPYEEIIRRDNPASLIPPWMEKAIEFLETKALGIQGVFRVSPPKSTLDDTKKKIDSAQDVDWGSLDEHVCTGTIKLFLRELPAPLLTFELYSKFVAAGDVDDEAAKVKTIKQVINELPKPNLALLKRLLTLIVLIERNKDVNKMTASNLAVVLCPSILYPEIPDPLTMVEDIQRANRVMSTMITHFTEIFGTVVSGPKLAHSSSSSAVNAASSSSAATVASSSTSLAHSDVATSQASQGAGLATSSSSGSLAAASSSSNLHSSGPSHSHPDKLTASHGKRSEPPAPNATGAGAGNLSGPSPSSSATSLTSSTPTKPHTSSVPGTPPDQSKTAPSTTTTTTTTTTTATASSSNANATPAPSSSSPAPTAVATTASVIAPSSASASSFPPVPSVDVGPKIDLGTMKTILQERSISSTYDYFMSLQEVAEATCQFASVTLTPGLSGEHLPALNNALKNLAKAIKNILASVKDFAMKLPPELRSRLLLAAKDLQDRVLVTAGAFKEFGEMPGGAATSAKLIDATRAFVIASYSIAARIKEFSLVDELLSASEAIVSLINQLPKSFSEDSTAIANNTNSLQNASFKLTALLRAKILDSSNQNLVKSLASCVESAEKETREICDDIKTLLFDESLAPEDIVISPDLEAKLKALSATATQAESFVDQLSPAQHPTINNSVLFSPVLEQLTANINTHTANPDPTIKAIVASLRAISDHINTLRVIQPEIPSKRGQWLEELFKVSEQLSAIAAATQKVHAATVDPTVQLTLASYLKTLSSMGLLIRISASAEAFDVQTCTDSLTRSMTYIKDFVFVSFPILFSIRDAIAQIEEDKQQS